MDHVIHNFHFAIACKSITDDSEPLVALHVARAFEEFIEDSIDSVLCRGNKPFHGNFIRKFARD